MCDDGNTTNGDGCNKDCKDEDPACADQTRDGLLSKTAYPAMAMCGGTWTGWVGATGAGTAGALCGTGWHVCTYTDTTALKLVPPDIAFGPGCWAMNAANHGSLCEACGNNQQRDMAGFGQDCGGGIVTGVMCCKNQGSRWHRTSPTSAMCGSPGSPGGSGAPRRVSGERGHGDRGVGRRVRK